MHVIKKTSPRPNLVQEEEEEEEGGGGGGVL